MHIEVTGCGEPLVMLHGWGMHGGVWGGAAQKLAADFQVHCVDLPGHGLNGMGEEGRGKGRPPELQLPFNLDSIVSGLSAEFSEPVSVCGWSLGGQIALHWAAREPGKVRRLILVASTPCFAERDDWMFGMPGDILEKFAEELEKNHAATLRRFIALQLRGSDHERELLAMLRERLFSRGEPDMGALRGGLDILRDADLRESLSGITQPALVIAGERDKLTPPEASYYLAQAMQNARVVEVEGAAHAPFLSHPDFFVDQVKSFLHE